MHRFRLLTNTELESNPNLEPRNTKHETPNTRPHAPVAPMPYAMYAFYPNPESREKPFQAVLFALKIHRFSLLPNPAPETLDREP